MEEILLARERSEASLSGRAGEAGAAGFAFIGRLRWGKAPGLSRSFSAPGAPRCLVSRLPSPVSRLPRASRQLGQTPQASGPLRREVFGASAPGPVSGRASGGVHPRFAAEIEDVLDRHDGAGRAGLGGHPNEVGGGIGAVAAGGGET